MTRRMSCRSPDAGDSKPNLRTYETRPTAHTRAGGSATRKGLRRIDATKVNGTNNVAAATEAMPIAVTSNDEREAKFHGPEPLSATTATVPTPTEAPRATPVAIAHLESISLRIVLVGLTEHALSCAARLQIIACGSSLAKTRGGSAAEPQRGPRQLLCGVGQRVTWQARATARLLAPPA